MEKTEAREEKYKSPANANQIQVELPKEEQLTPPKEQAASVKSILKGDGSASCTRKQNGQNGPRKIGFQDQIAEVIEVENWGEYNREPPKKGKGIGCCQLF